MKPVVKRFFAALCLLAAGRASAPWAVTAWVNQVLEGLDGMHGSIADVDLNLWRGAYEVDQLEIFQMVDGRREPFARAARVDLSLQWGALLHGSIVADVVLHRPVVQVTLRATEEKSQTGTEVSWTERLGELLPIRVNRFVIRDGELRFEDVRTEPRVDLYMDDLYMEVLNVSNARDEGRDDVPATLEAAARPFGTGEFELRMRFSPLADPPRFELDAALREVAVTDLNDFLRAYGDVDAEAGRLSVYTEFAAKNGRLLGYVKTLLEDLEILSWGEIENPLNALEALWEGFVALAAEVFENPSRDRLAAYIPLEGDLGEISTDTFELVGSILHNAFLVAMSPALDGTVGLGDLRAADEQEVSNAFPEAGLKRQGGSS